MKPFWVTFYSYKGGVGRSLALANIAALLVRKGRRVVLIDFDLEAPGLDSFSEFSLAASRDGVIEYVSEFTRTEAAPNITRFVHPCQLPGNPRGKLWLMPAGRKDSTYNHHLSRINWVQLYESGLGAAFIANWKAAIETEYKPDFIFIDSRTGLTEVGGVCTTQFPDLVVMLFGLNEQNIRGTAAVAQSIREANPERVPQIHFVASPVPNILPGEKGTGTTARNKRQQSLTDERFEAASRILAAEVKSRIHYYAPAALNEKIFVINDSATSAELSPEYRRAPKRLLRRDMDYSQNITWDYYNLCEELVHYNRTGLDFLVEQAEEAIEANDTPLAERIGGVLDRDFPDRAEAIFQQSKIALARNNASAAVSYAKKAFELEPRYSPPVEFLTAHFIRQGKHDEADQILSHLLSFHDQLSEDRLQSIQFLRGEILMVLSKYEEAEKCYRACIAFEEELDAPPSLQLINKFNAAEAHRRASKIIDRSEWLSVLALYEKNSAISDELAANQANRLQAIHVAYAVLGMIDMAKTVLTKARRAAEAVSEIEDIFSPRQYRRIRVEAFLEENALMLAAIERGELWDGMKIPILVVGQNESLDLGKPRGFSIGL